MLPAGHRGQRCTPGGAALPVDEVADAAGTIGYELLAGMPPRVPRIDAPEGRRVRRIARLQYTFRPPSASESAHRD
jgi:hypothetical protein